MTDTATTTTTRRTPRAVTASELSFQQLSAVWNTLDGAQKSSWQTCAEQMSGGMMNNMPTRTSAYAAFVNINSANLATTGTILSDAPAPPAVPPAITVVGFDPSWAGGTLLLSLSLPGFSGPALIYGAAPRLAGQPLYRTTQFKLLGAHTFPAGSAPPFNAGDLYNAKFRVPGPGYQIALRLIPVTETGFRGTPRLITATVPVSAAALAPSLGDAATLKVA